MLFNSLQFAIFLPIVFILYWFLINKNTKAQNILLLVASYVFYGWWDWRFLFLLGLLSMANFFIGIEIEKNAANRRSKNWFIIGLITNIGILCGFKYYNFFIDGFIDLVSLIGYDLPRSTTKIIHPVGISFYVFLSLSYIIDIYKKNLHANRNVVEVLLTLSFFPIILAGPIQRPASLLPQIAKKREFNYDRAVDGLKQILWGLFAKVIIADRSASLVDEIFLNYSEHSGSTLALGAVLYTVQIYADFSGYSNIAIGIAKLFGFSLMQNFAYPYFSRDITEFWKRWHISLVTWFRDYVFLPTSFTISWRIRSEKVLFIKTDIFIYIIASTIVWFLTGLWHGANYTFILWGMIHGFFLIIYRIQIKPRKRIFKKMGIKNNNGTIVILEAFITLFIVIIAWIFFRADNVGHAWTYVSEMFSKSLFTAPSIKPLRTILLVCLFFIIEWFGRANQCAIAQLGTEWRQLLRYAMYYAITAAIIWLSGNEQEFLYFQF
jgi:D-alanyl-lipoteichoic acid acyltransferase DltB (MBOAT superfamily)